MASEKGATYLDKLCHKFYDHPKRHGEKTDYVCRLCGGPLETYYCEERLYLVQCTDCGTFALVKTANPEDAARVTMARPTITPPNEWVSVEDRLPTEETNVLVFAVSRYASGQEIFIDRMMQSKDGLIWVYTQNHYEITHWMPLPEPPKGE